MHAYDRLLAMRTLLAAALFAALALGVVLATDEPFSTPGMRVARMSALAPLLGALAVALAVAQARARGELRALSALGAGPLRSVAGALVAGWLVAAVAVVLVLTPLADVTALFPVVAAPTEWRVENGRLLSPASGVTVSPDGVLELWAASGPGRAEGAPHAASAALAIGPLGLAAPLWASCPLSFVRRLLAALLSVALVLVLLHAVAAGRISSFALVLPALPLALDFGVSHFRRGIA